MKLEALKYLRDIIESLDVLEHYRPVVISVESIAQNRMLNDALQRRLSIIGEALYQANKLDKDIAITDKQRIIGMRHILVHDYDKIREDTLYITVTRHLDLLRQEVETILNAHPPQGPMELDD